MGLYPKGVAHDEAHDGHADKAREQLDQPQGPMQPAVVIARQTTTGRKLHQHTTVNECLFQYVLPEGESVLGFGWINIWMVHMCLFERNPKGVFGNIHPCIDPWAPSESEFNDDRPVPMFFEHHAH
jgi:hypothetical protein